MTDKEALAVLLRGQNVAQSTLQRLRLQDLIICDDITTLDSTERRVLKFIAFTERGQQLLES
ncbi:MAG: hypothetical protein DMG89_09180 [Acidobacteria bacterium]|nr:MAG: hypothetical protein DMG89_09180 [Acidobacteriota bacterium]